MVIGSTIMPGPAVFHRAGKVKPCVWSLCLSVVSHVIHHASKETVAAVCIIRGVANRKSTWRRSAVVSEQLPVASHTQDTAVI